MVNPEGAVTRIAYAETATANRTPALCSYLNIEAHTTFTSDTMVITIDLDAIEAGGESRILYAKMILDVQHSSSSITMQLRTTGNAALINKVQTAVAKQQYMYTLLWDDVDSLWAVISVT